MSEVLLSPFRIILLVIGVFLLHQVITRRDLKTYHLDYIMKYAIISGSMVMIVIFLMVLTNLYDTFSILLFFFFFFLWQYLGIKRGGDFRLMLAEKRVSFLVTVFKFVERNPRLSLRAIVKKSKWFFVPKRINYLMVTAVSAAFACLFSRFQFLKNDLYTLSGVWLKKLEAVKALNNNIWFGSNLAMPGEKAAINFYSRIINISEELALHSFGLLETFGLSLILFWIVFQFTGSKYSAPLVALVTFGFLYRILPMNINLLLEHNPIYMALCFAFPAMLFSVKPFLLTSDKKYFTLQIGFIYFALCLVNLFVFLFMVPVFLLVAIVLSNRTGRSYVMRSVLAYISTLILIFTIYLAVCWFHNEPFLNFFRENLILVDVYTYFPHLLLPLTNLLHSYTILGWVTFVAVIPLYILDRSKWMPIAVFTTYFNLIMCLRFVQWDWIDMDMFYQVLSPMIVILIGVIVGLVRIYLKLLVPNRKGIRVVLISSLCLVLLIVTFRMNAFVLTGFNQKDHLKTDVLLVYNKLSKNYLPYSYTVVNGNYGFQISSYKHGFISYDFFLSEYLKIDMLNEKFKSDKEYLAEHPELILPATVFVFVAMDNGKSATNNLITPEGKRMPLEGIIDTLIKRGRNIEVFYDVNDLKVYKITNKKNASNLDELIFSL